MSTAITVYQESVRRLELMICVIALRVLYLGLPNKTAQAMIASYSRTLRKLKVEFNYTGGDNIDYKRLHCEFTLGEDTTDIYYDPASEPSGISYAESVSLKAEHTKLLLTSETYTSEVC